MTLVAYTPAGVTLSTITLVGGPFVEGQRCTEEDESLLGPAEFGARCRLIDVA
jgi:hypothetical protein